MQGQKRGEIWAANLPGEHQSKVHAGRGKRVLIVSKDQLNSDSRIKRVAVIPRRTFRGRTEKTSFWHRPPPGCIKSPHGEGGCDMRAFFDCLQLLRIQKKFSVKQSSGLQTRLSDRPLSESRLSNIERAIMATLQQNLSERISQFLSSLWPQLNPVECPRGTILQMKFGKTEKTRYILVLSNDEIRARRWKEDINLTIVVELVEHSHDDAYPTIGNPIPIEINDAGNQRTFVARPKSAQTIDLKMRTEGVNITHTGLEATLRQTNNVAKAVLSIMR